MYLLYNLMNGLINEWNNKVFSDNLWAVGSSVIGTILYIILVPLLYKNITIAFFAIGAVEVHVHW